MPGSLFMQTGRGRSCEQSNHAGFSEDGGATEIKTFSRHGQYLLGIDESPAPLTTGEMTAEVRERPHPVAYRRGAVTQDSARAADEGERSE